MKVTYKYDGVITPMSADCIPRLIKQYPFVIEVDGIMDPELIGKVLTKHTYTVDTDGFGDCEERTGVLYGICSVSQTSDRQLYFFKTQRDKDLFFSTFDEYVLNYYPIKTEVSINLKSYQVLKQLIVGVLYRVCGPLLPKGWRGNT